MTIAIHPRDKFKSACQEMNNGLNTREKPKFINDSILKVIHYWNNQPGLQKLQLPTFKGKAYVKSTKRFDQTVNAVRTLISGSFFAKTELARYGRRFTSDEICQIIDRFALAVNSPRHKPVHKDHLRRLTFYEVCYCPYKKGTGRSYFLYYLNHEPEVRLAIADVVPEDKFPALTAELERQYRELFLALDKERSLSFKEKTWLTLTSNRIKGFWDNDMMTAVIPILTVNGMIARFITAALDWAEKRQETVDLRTLSQPWMIEVFKAYLISRGYFEGEQVLPLPDEDKAVEVQKKSVTDNYVFVDESDPIAMHEALRQICTE